MKGTASEFANECREDYRHYREKCRAAVRDGVSHGLYVKLAWMNRCNARKWESQVA